MGELLTKRRHRERMLSMISLIHTGMSPTPHFFTLHLNRPSFLIRGQESALNPRIEHAYRQSAPDSYGTGLGMMGGNMGGMGINNLPGSQMMLMGRGGGYPVG